MTTLISFFTKDANYPQHAKRLSKECEKLGVPYKIEELPSTGSYLKNTCLKPNFILEKLKELKSPVLWVDVDASIYKFPDLCRNLSDYCDFAARPMAEHRKRTWHVGTMWFNYTPSMIAFIEEWVRNTGNLSDESSLEKTWQDFRCISSCADLPPEYFYIEQRGKHPPHDVVIMHRISNSQMKRSEMPLAKKKRESGEW